MKSLKYAIVSAILALGIAAPIASAQDASGSAPAQQGPAHHKRMRDMTKPWLKGITLTDDQKSQVKAIRADSNKQYRAISDQQDRRAQARSIRQDEQQKIRAILTPDQQATFDANLQAMQQRMSRHHEQASGSGSGAQQ